MLVIPLLLRILLKKGPCRDPLIRIRLDVFIFIRSVNTWALQYRVFEVTDEHQIDVAGLLIDFEILVLKVGWINVLLFQFLMDSVVTAGFRVRYILRAVAKIVVCDMTRVWIIGKKGTTRVESVLR
jgi:hypothetical protein